MRMSRVGDGEDGKGGGEILDIRCVGRYWTKARGVGREGRKRLGLGLELGFGGKRHAKDLGRRVLNAEKWYWTCENRVLVE